MPSSISVFLPSSIISDSVNGIELVELFSGRVELDSKRISLAPSDYTSSEDEAEKEREEYKTFAKSQKPARKKESMGSFGELLKAKLKQKKD